MKRILFLLLACAGCGSVDPPHISDLTERQPYVVSVNPPDGERLHDSHPVSIRFSQPIDPKSLTPESFFIAAVGEGEVEVDASQMMDDVSDGRIQGVEGDFAMEDGGKTILFTASRPFQAKTRFGIMVTSALFSVERLPFNQTPGENPTPFFSSFYSEGVDESSKDGGNWPVDTASIRIPRPKWLVLNEILYDAAGKDTEGDLFMELLGEPERDIEGYRIVMLRGDDGKIVDFLTIPKGMRTDAEGFFVIADSLTGASGMTNVPNADWVKNFDPPNGPDCLQLVDPEGNLIDALGYGAPLVLRGENNLFCFKGNPAEDGLSGSSLARVSGAEDHQDNSLDWVVNAKPTPGQINGEIANEEP